MSAPDNLHPQQLQMFMRPHEIMGLVKGSVEAGDKPENVRNWQRTKLRESQMEGSDGWSLYKSIKEEGVHAPVIISGEDVNMNRSDHFWLGNGHHRVAAAEEVEKTTGKEVYIPVLHDEDFMGSRKTRESFPGVPAW